VDECYLAGCDAAILAERPHCGRARTAPRLTRNRLTEMDPSLVLPHSAWIMPPGERGDGVAQS
jgi:hypothetical protein